MVYRGSGLNVPNVADTYTDIIFHSRRVSTSVCYHQKIAPISRFSKYLSLVDVYRRKSRHYGLVCLQSGLAAASWARGATTTLVHFGIWPSVTPDSPISHGLVCYPRGCAGSPRRNNILVVSPYPNAVCDPSYGDPTPTFINYFGTI